MIVNSIDYQIGNGIGEFTAGDGLTCKMIGIVGQDGIKAILYGNAAINSGWNVIGDYLDFSNVIGTSNGTKLTIDLKHPLTINTNDV